MYFLVRAQKVKVEFNNSITLTKQKLDSFKHYTLLFNPLLTFRGYYNK